MYHFQGNLGTGNGQENINRVPINQASINTENRGWETHFTPNYNLSTNAPIANNFTLKNRQTNAANWNQVQGYPECQLNSLGYERNQPSMHVSNGYLQIDENNRNRVSNYSNNGPPAVVRQIPSRTNFTPLKSGTFDGSTSWTDFERQFRIIAQLNNWEPTVMAATLTGSLRGAALTVLSTLTDSDLTNYEKICNAFSLRYGDEHLSKLYYTQQTSKSKGRFSHP